MCVFVCRERERTVNKKSFSMKRVLNAIMKSKNSRIIYTKSPPQSSDGNMKKVGNQAFLSP